MTPLKRITFPRPKAKAKTGKNQAETLSLDLVIKYKPFDLIQTIDVLISDS